MIYTPEQLNFKALTVARNADPRATRVSWDIEVLELETHLIITYRAGGKYQVVPVKL